MIGFCDWSSQAAKKLSAAKAHVDGRDVERRPQRVDPLQTLIWSEPKARTHCWPSPHVPLVKSENR